MNPKFEPGVYEVTEDFYYFSSKGPLIKKDEILHVGVIGDRRVLGNVWNVFYRDTQQCAWFNASKIRKFFIEEPKMYNALYLPINKVIKK